MEEIGKFRTVAVDDLGRFHYQENLSRMKYELRALEIRGLIRRRQVRVPRGSLQVVFLTKQGKRMLDKERKESRNGIQLARRIYAGLVKPAEISHDAAIYRMYQLEAAEIRIQGAKIRRVVLDYELKKRVYSPLAKARNLPPEEFRKRQQEVAQMNGLIVVEGKIPLPDLRIEYETSEGERSKVDLELATGHYKTSQLAEKIAARGSTSSRSGVVQDERELTAAILSL
jgi:hypothetical protein